jgi:hypothetical protein
MTKYIRRMGTPLALSVALLAGACQDNDTAEDTNASLAQDTALNRDLELASRDTAAQPQLTDVPAATEEVTPAPVTPAPAAARPAPVRTRPRPAPARPAPEAKTPTTTASGNTVERGERGSEGRIAAIPAGTQISFTSNDRVCTNTRKVGDTFTATVSEPVTGENGATIPAGATATIRVTELKRSENANDNVVVGLAVQSISYGGKTYPVDANVSYAKVDKVRNSSRGNDAKKVIGGAIAGAILGQAIGKDTKGTVIGAAGGAAAGTAAAAATANFEGCVPQGGRITIVLNSAAQVTAE